MPNIVEDSVHHKIEKGIPVSEEDWARIILQIALARSALHRFEQATLSARAEPRLEWSFDEAERLAHPELILEDWNEEWKEEDWNIERHSSCG